MKTCTAHMCPVCGKYEFPSGGCFEPCLICGWEDDAVQEAYPDETDCSNELSFNQHKKLYDEGKMSFEIKFGKKCSEMFPEKAKKHGLV